MPELTLSPSQGFMNSATDCAQPPHDNFSNLCPLPYSRISGQDSVRDQLNVME
jgi:hypothetical protein